MVGMGGIIPPATGSTGTAWEATSSKQVESWGQCCLQD